jgi:MOSC domain-containing protein YiiM
MKTARIFQINASNGGVPKRPLRRAEVDASGITVDKQTHTQVHGGPYRALCLYALERIQALQAEGHPIYPGSVGENVTISGLDWDQVVPGMRLKLGEVIVEITSYAAPCNLIEGSFTDQDSSRISQTKHPGWARAYSRVVQTGSLQIGDKVSWERAGDQSLN